MKHNFKILNILFTSLLFIFVISCSKNELDRGDQMLGFAQFNLAKNISTTKSEQIESFDNLSKIRISLISEDEKIITQYLSLEKYNNHQYDFGMLSEKLSLLAGIYKLISYDLLDKLDVIVDSYEYNNDNMPQIKVIQGGLTVHELLANVKGNGYVKFKLTKDISELPVSTKSSDSGVSKYPFHQIQFVEIYVKNNYTEKEIKLKGYKVSHKFVSDNEDYISGVAIIDTTYSLPAGEYEIVRYITYRNKTVTGNSDYFEICDKVKENSFTVSDNKTVNVDVPIKLVESAPYIKDAYNLYKIWLALDGPNWAYKGKTHPKGSNWSFENRDMDMWLAQPGVSVLSNGRVAIINFSGFGAKGDMPDCIGELDELRQLYLGSSGNDVSDGELSTYNALPPLDNVVSEEDLQIYSKKIFNQFAERYSYNGITEEVISPELLKSYDYTDNKLSVKVADRFVNDNSARRVKSPIYFQSKITSLPKTIGNLKKLESLYISSTPMSSLPDELSGCEGLVNLEIYNCPNFTAFPSVIGNMPNLTGLVFSGNNNVSSEALLDGLKKLNEDSGNSNIRGIQLLFLNGQKLSYLPDLTNLKNLALLNLINCGIDRIETAFGKDHYFTQLILNGNNLSSLPKDKDGYFMALHSDFEYLGLSNNKFEEVPNIFLGNSINKLGNIDFSNNNISRFEDGSSWRGIYTEIFNLSYNKLTEFPLEIFPKNDNCSQISFLQLQGNLIDTIKNAAFEGSKAFYLTTLDLSLNRLSSLPASFNRVNLAYLVGVELSYNRFNKFMFTPLNIPSLSVYMFRGQRDKNGNKCMREWPTGIYQHLGMRNLYLTDNDIRLVNDKISPNIFVLDISGNNNIVIDLTNICPYIKAARYFLLYDPSQDIRGCDALRLN